MICVCLLDDAIYDPDILSDSSVSQKTRLVVIADLRQNFFNAISDGFISDFTAELYGLYGHALVTLYVQFLCCDWSRFDR